MTEIFSNSAPEVSIIIVTWNAKKFLPFLFDSIEKQTFKDFNVLVIDNASLDNTAGIINDKYFPLAKVVRQKNNSGFSKGFNLGIHWTSSKYVLILNQDLVLDSEFLEVAVDFMNKNSKVGALQGKILQWETAGNKKLDLVDNLGINIYKNHSFLNRHEGEKSPKLEKNARPVFAFSGSCALLRRQALDEIKYKQEFFDEDFFMYKEDIDLSWRLRHKNWNIVYYPPAVAFHSRTLKNTVCKDNLSIAAHRYTKRKQLNYLSYRNHLYTLFKNQFYQNFIFYFFYIFWYEFKKLIFIILAEPGSLKAWIDFLINIFKFYKKRRYILKNSKLKPADLRSWIK